MNNFHHARSLLEEFQGDAYLYGLGVLGRSGGHVGDLGLVKNV